MSVSYTPPFCVSCGTDGCRGLNGDLSEITGRLSLKTRAIAVESDSGAAAESGAAVAGGLLSPAPATGVCSFDVASCDTLSSTAEDLLLLPRTCWTRVSGRDPPERVTRSVVCGGSNLGLNRARLAFVGD